MKGVKHTGESQKRTAEMRQQMGNKKGFATGGRVAAYDAGAASGPGRLEKISKYGAKAKPGK